MILGDLDTASKKTMFGSGGSLQKGEDLELENETLKHFKKKKVGKCIPPYFKTVIPVFSC